MSLIDSVLGNILYYFHKEGEKELILRSILKSYPRWAKGHWLLSEIHYQKREWSLSYVSLAAAKVLKFQPTQLAILESKILIQVKRPADAVSRLLPLVEDNSGFNSAAAEELVAAYMQLDEYQRAYEVLCKFQDHGGLHGSLKAAHDFVLSKISQ